MGMGRAEHGYETALELDPSSAAAHGKYMFHFAIIGRFEEDRACETGRGLRPPGA